MQDHELIGSIWEQCILGWDTCGLFPVLSFSNCKMEVMT